AGSRWPGRAARKRGRGLWRWGGGGARDGNRSGRAWEGARPSITAAQTDRDRSFLLRVGGRGTLHAEQRPHVRALAQGPEILVAAAQHLDAAGIRFRRTPKQRHRLLDAIGQRRGRRRVVERVDETGIRRDGPVELAPR